MDFHIVDSENNLDLPSLNFRTLTFTKDEKPQVVVPLDVPKTKKPRGSRNKCLNLLDSGTENDAEQPNWRKECRSAKSQKAGLKASKASEMTTPSKQQDKSGTSKPKPKPKPKPAAESRNKGSGDVNPNTGDAKPNTGDLKPNTGAIRKQQQQQQQDKSQSANKSKEEKDLNGSYTARRLMKKLAFYFIAPSELSRQEKKRLASEYGFQLSEILKKVKQECEDSIVEKILDKNESEQGPRKKVTKDASCQTVISGDILSSEISQGVDVDVKGNKKYAALKLELAIKHLNEKLLQLNMDEEDSDSEALDS